MSSLRAVLILTLTFLAGVAVAQTDMRRGGGGYGPGFRPGPGGSQWGPGGGGPGGGPGGGANGGNNGGCWNCGYMGMMGSYESGNPIPTMPPPPPRYQSESVNGDWYY